MAASTPGKGSPKEPGREPWRGLRCEAAVASVRP